MLILRSLLKRWEVKSITKEVRLKKGFFYDALVEVRIGEEIYKLVIEVKSVGQPRQIREVISRLMVDTKKDKNCYPVIVAPYISEAGRRICLRNKIGFLDLSGHCYLAFGTVLVKVDSGEINKYKEEKTLKSISKPKSLQVLRALSNDPKRNWLLKDLRKEARVSLGHAFNVVNRLLDWEWIERNKKGYLKVLQPDKLSDLLLDISNNKKAEFGPAKVNL